MMTIAKLSEDLYVAPQIDPADIAGLKARGIRAIVNNRPDGEAPGQPTGAEIEAAAAAQGLGYRAVPVVPGRIGDADVAAFAEAQATLPGPVLAFCRSGTRSATLWALANATTLDVDTVLRRAAEAGYDLRGLAPALAARREGLPG